ncbi:MAG: T9SS type A sorting domain-containing protein [Sphingobacteriaceae bacterium]|nr:T9SS type A sorting domain-containing protein [Sphingobacteriaceae bacterium]
MMIYPNPSHGHFSINNVVNGSKLEIYNSTAQLIFSEIAEGSETHLHLENEPNGIYLIKCGHEIFKVVKQ